MWMEKAFFMNSCWLQGICPWELLIAHCRWLLDFCWVSRDCSRNISKSVSGSKLTEWIKMSFQGSLRESLLQIVPYKLKICTFLIWDPEKRSQISKCETLRNKMKTKRQEFAVVAMFIFLLEKQSGMYFQQEVNLSSNQKQTNNLEWLWAVCPAMVKTRIDMQNGFV